MSLSSSPIASSPIVSGSASSSSSPVSSPAGPEKHLSPHPMFVNPNIHDYGSRNITLVVNCLGIVNPVPPVLDVDMDKYYIAKGYGARTGSSGAGPCFIVHFSGRDYDGVPIRATVHTTHLMRISAVFQFMITEMVKPPFRAAPTSIQSYCLGGQTDHSGELGGKRKADETDTSKYEEEVVCGALEEDFVHRALRKRYNLQGVEFNLAEGEDQSISSTLGPEGISVTKGTIDCLSRTLKPSANGYLGDLGVGRKIDFFRNSAISARNILHS